MRTGSASKHERLLRLFRRHSDQSVARGLSSIRFSGVGDGSQLTIDGRDLVNFGNCSYLGLAVDERLKQAAINAVNNFGVLYSSSQTYTAIDLYDELEELLLRMTDVEGVVIPSTTTLGHLSCLPTLLGEGDAVVLDSQSHASLQLTVQVLASRGIPIHTVNHGDQDALETEIARLSPRHRQVWYLADGVYSMYGDMAPTDAIADLMDAYDNLFVYLDDAHGFSWYGLHGRGYALSEMNHSERLVVAVGLAKSFGSGGAALFFGDREMALDVRHLGGPMTFSGPIHPPTLGAAIESARIHLSEDHIELRGQMADQISLTSTQLAGSGLPVVSWANTPVWMVRVGDFGKAMDLTQRMMDDGFYLNLTAFPGVPIDMAGLRFTHTLRNTDSQIVAMVERLAANFADVVGEVEAVVDLTEAERVSKRAERIGR